MVQNGIEWNWKAKGRVWLQPYNAISYLPDKQIYSLKNITKEALIWPVSYPKLSNNETTPFLNSTETQSWIFLQVFFILRSNKILKRTVVQLHDCIKKCLHIVSLNFPLKLTPLPLCEHFSSRLNSFPSWYNLCPRVPPF